MVEKRIDDKEDNSSEILKTASEIEAELNKNNLQTVGLPLPGHEFIKTTDDGQGKLTLSRFYTMDSGKTYRQDTHIFAEEGSPNKYSRLKAGLALDNMGGRAARQSWLGEEVK